MPKLSKMGSNPFLFFSLRTDIPSDAREITARLTAMTSLAFDYARGCPNMDQDTLRGLLTELVRFEIAAFEKTRLTTGPRSLAAAEFASEREQAIQEALRQAIFLRDWEAVRAPLECVAKRLNIALPDVKLTYATLALEALKVSIDISRERESRDRGEYSEQTPIFRHAIRSDLGIPTPKPSIPKASEALETAFAVTFTDDQAPSAAPQAPQLKPKNIIQHAIVPTASHSEPLTADKTNTSNIREILRSKNLLRACSEETIALLEKGDDVSLSEGFDIYIDFKRNGCVDDWERKQKPDTISGKKWVSSSLPSLKVAKAIWVDLLKNQSICAIEEDEVDDAIAIIRNIPKNHGKWTGIRADHGYLKLIEQVQNDETRAMNLAERQLHKAGCTNEEEIRDARLAQIVPRMRVETYQRHVRCAKRIGTMLHSLGITETNIFKDCGFSNDETKRLKATEDKIQREKWDDREQQLFSSPVFQGGAKSEDDPIFWMTLLARCHGLRSEEGAQLGPNDISTDKNIAYLRIRQQVGDSVKSDAGFRKIPIHPALIELNFMELVKRARIKGSKRLFPTMTRGKSKDNFTENFTKSFNHYRKKNGVYWHGLDFHALRTTFHHDLMDGSVPGYIKRNLMGHEPLDEGEKSYAQNGISINTLHDHICKIPFDAKSVRSPIHCSKPTLLSARAEKHGLKIVGR
ncbi:tyrosine-type recombinase/integrase [Sulfitobacter undariae]|nr:tyrosine-type recombinase/integrase [Sulfitobacter undariae]